MLERASLLRTSGVAARYLRARPGVNDDAAATSVDDGRGRELSDVMWRYEMVVMSCDVRRRAADDAEVSRRDTAALRTT